MFHCAKIFQADIDLFLKDLDLLVDVMGWEWNKIEPCT